MTSLRRTHIALAMGIALAAPGLASAASVTTNLGVSANVLSACVVSALPVNFGSYDPTATTPTDAIGSITVLCTAGTAFNVALGPGLHSTSVTSRQMQAATTSDLLGYGLYRDSARTLNWGNTTGTVQTATAGALPLSFTVYGRIPPGENVNTDAYSDTVLVTVNY